MAYKKLNSFVKKAWINKLLDKRYKYNKPVSLLFQTNGKTFFSMDKSAFYRICDMYEYEKKGKPYIAKWIAKHL